MENNEKEFKKEIIATIILITLILSIVFFNVVKLVKLIQW